MIHSPTPFAYACRRVYIAAFLALPLLGSHTAASPGSPNTQPSPHLYRVFEATADRKTYGFIDAAGRIVVPPRFSGARDFSDGLALVWDSSGQFFLDSSGAIAFRVPAGCEWISNFSEGLCAINKGGRPEIDGVSAGVWGYLTRNGDVAIEARFSGPVDRPVGAFSEGRAAFTDNGKWGYIDLQGKVAIRPAFDEVRSFRDGVAPVRRDKKWFLVAPGGDVATEPRFDELLVFSEGLGAARVGKTVGFIRREGDWAFTLPASAQFGQAARFSDGLAAILLPMHGVAGAGESCPHCGLPVAGIRYGGKCPHCGFELVGPRRYGYVDRDGREVVEAVFNDARPFSEDLAAVQQKSGGPWGFIDRRGRFAITARFSSVDGNGFRAGLARVGIGRNDLGWNSYIDTRGRVVWSSRDGAD